MRRLEVRLASLVVAIVAGGGALGVIIGKGYWNSPSSPAASSLKGVYMGGPNQVLGLVERPSDPQFLPAWQFVNFVHGQGPAPKFAQDVTVVIDGETRVVTSVQAVQRSTWRGSPLDLYTVAKGYTLRDGGQATPPTLTMYVDSGHDFVCGGRDLPSRFASSPSLWLGLVPAGPGVPSSCTFLNVFVNHGTIDVLVARTSRGL